MNTWNSDLVRAGFTKQSAGFITKIDGQVELQHPIVANAYRAIIAEQQVSPKKALRKAREYYKSNHGSPSFPYNEPTFGYVIQWLSELGQNEELEGLLAYADTHLNATWDNGGLFYPRNDQATDSDGAWTHMDPFSGNAAIGYARLNVEDGQKKMWERPWTKEYLATQPWIDGLDFSQGVDCLRGVWDKWAAAMIVTVREWAGKGTRLGFVVRGLPAGTWMLYQGKDAPVKHEVVTGQESILVEAELGAGEEVDFVIMRYAA